MATINLGAIKFNWRGAYAGGTAYAVDDVVSSGGSSYVCILASTGNAVSNGTYWEIMAQVGAEGGSTILTTQGDILYRDGSGLQRLPKGTAGQVLQMNSGATAPEYATASSGGAVGNVQQVNYTGTTSFTGSGRGSTNYHNIAGLNMTFSRDSQTSKTLLNYNVYVGIQADGWVSAIIQYSTNGSSFTDVPGIASTFSNTSIPRGHIGGTDRGGAGNGQDYDFQGYPCSILHDTSGIASSTIYYRLMIWNSHGANTQTLYINRAVDSASTGDDNRALGTSQLTVMEIL